MVDAARFTLSGICGFEVTTQAVRKALESALAVAPAPSELSLLQADNAALREALSPFAAEAKTWPADQAPDDYQVKIMLATKTLPSKFTAGDLRRALAAFISPAPAEHMDGAVEALRAAEPYVELCHSLMSKKETRAQVWKVLKQVRAALDVAEGSKG
jgi:hypothetical protein